MPHQLRDWLSWTPHVEYKDLVLVHPETSPHVPIISAPVLVRTSCSQQGCGRGGCELTVLDY